MSDDLSIDSDVAFAFVDFSEVDFGDDGKKNTDNVIGHQVVEKLQAGMQDPEVDDEYDNEFLNATQAEKLQVTFPGGQNPEMDHDHDAELFQLQCLRLENLVKWHELGVRPKKNKTNLAAHNQDEDLFQTSTDDLKQLLLRSIEAQDEVNKNLPPHPVADYENDLKVATSSIENAGNGLFTTVFIPKGAVVCHYTGYRHHCKCNMCMQNVANMHVSFHSSLVVFYHNYRPIAETSAKQRIRAQATKWLAKGEWTMKMNSSHTNEARYT
jgi:hypothetical protein